MARINDLEDFLDDVSSAIKQKLGDNSPIPASEFDTKILSITTPGLYQNKELTITQNGNYVLNPDQGYDALSNVRIGVDVDLSGDYVEANPPITPGTKTKITYDAKGLVTGGENLSASDIPDLSSTYIATSTKGQANGVATLDSNSKVPVAQIPDLSSTYIAVTLKGANDGVAELGNDGKVPSSQLSIATQSEAETGSNDTKIMTPLKVKQAIDLILPTMYSCTLNPDGTINSYDNTLTYDTVKTKLEDDQTPVYLDVTQQTLRFYVQAIQDINNDLIKFIGIYNKDNNKCLIEFNLLSNDTLTVEISLLEKLSNKTQDIISNSTNTVLYPSAKAVFDQFQRKPVVVWESNDPTTYLKAITANISASPAWQLTNLDMTPFKRIKIYSCAGQSTGSTASASTTTAMILEMSLDSRAAIAAYGGNYVGSIVSQKPNDNNRLATLTCAVSADKTSFVVLRQTNLYGTAATNNNDVNANVFMIEGYYD